MKHGTVKFKGCTLCRSEIDSVMYKRPYWYIDMKTNIFFNFHDRDLIKGGRHLREILNESKKGK